jgi:hypothetical protein
MKLFIFCILLFNLNTRAEIIAIRGQKVSMETFKEQLYLEPNYKAFSAYYMDQITKTIPNEELIELFAAARKAELLHDLHAAKIYYYKISALRYNHDWQTPERKLLMHSFLRISELASTKNEKLEWQKIASSWMPLTYEWQTLVTEKSFNEIKALSKKEVVKAPWPPAWKHFDLALINGEPFYASDTQKGLTHPRGRMRLTLLSDSYKPVTSEMDGTQVALFEPERLPLAHGRCDGNATNLSSAPQDSVLILKDCIKPLSEDNDKAALPIKSLSSNNTRPELTNNFTAESRAKTILKSGGFWTGLGLLIGAALYIDYEKHRERPTYKEGF